MTTSITDTSKVSNLWKTSRGVVDIHKENVYTADSERPFVRQTLNKEVFSDEVPELLGTVPPTWNAPNYNNSLPDYSVENLDASFNSLFLNGNNAYARGTVHNLAVIGYPQLDYYHRHQFIPFSTSNLLPNGNATTWYIPDPSDSDLSLARNTIPFNKGGRGDYQYKFRITSTTGTFDFGVQELEDPYKFVFDNQSGFILIYSDDDSVASWALDATSAPLYGSFIKYVGAKGASGSGGGGSFQGGLDASFNNVDISNNLNIIHDDLETGILQSKRISYNLPNPNSALKQKVIIAKVEDIGSKLLNATGYFTLELKDGSNSLEAEQAHTKIHFLAGITTKEATNQLLSPSPLSASPPISPISTSPPISPISTNNVNNNLQVAQPIATLDPITITPITGIIPPIQPIIDPAPPGVSPIVDSDDDENTLPVTTLSSNTSTGVEFTGFIKVLSCIRQFHDPTVPNIGIESLELASVTNTNLCYLILDIKVDPPVTTLNFNVRLYKNSLNIMDSINHLQWTLTNIQYPALTIYPVIKKLFIGAGPDVNTLGPLNYPNHPTEPFTATTQYTIVDNSMNVYGNLNIKGDVNVDTNIRLSGKIQGELSDLYTHRVFTNSDFLSENIANGSWETIAYVPLITSNELSVRSGYAHFEVVDRSNPDSDYKFKDTLSFIVNFVPSSNDHASCSLTLLSSTAARNEESRKADGTAGSGWSNSVNTSNTGNYGYIEKVAVELGEVRLAVSDVNSNLVTRTGAIVKIFRKSDAPSNFVSFTATTDVRVIMYNNMKTVNETLNGMQAFILGDAPNSYWHTVNSNYLLEFNLLKESSGHKTTFKGYQDRIIRGYTSSAFDKISGDTIIGEDISGSFIKGTNGKFDEVEIGTGADDVTVNLKYGGVAQNPLVNIDKSVISGGSGRVSKINSRPDHHGQITNRAYVQEEVIRVVPSGVSPGIEVSDGDWISIARIGPFDTSAAANVVNKNSFRGSALFELQDRSASHHHNVKFLATFQFDKACLKVISNSFYGHERFKHIRINYGDTYHGCILQFQIDTSYRFDTLGQNLYLKIWQNTNNSGWVCNEKFIKVENNPVNYVDNDVSGKYDTAQPNPTNSWIPGQNEYTAYPNEEKVDVRFNHTNDNNFYERFMNGILVQGGSKNSTSNIAMGGGDLELEGGNIYMNSTLTGTGVIEMWGGDITGADVIQAKTYTRATIGESIDIGGANKTQGHFTWFREPTRIYANTDQITRDYLNIIGFEGACMFNNGNGVKALHINRRLHDGVAGFDSANYTGTIGSKRGYYTQSDISSNLTEIKQFSLTSPFKETVLVSLVGRNTANSTQKSLTRGNPSVYGGYGVIGIDVTAGHLQFQGGYPGFDISSTTQNGQPTVPGLCYAPYDLYIHKIVSKHFSYRVDVENTTGSTRGVLFETYIAYGPSSSSQHPFQYNYHTFGASANGNFPEDITCPEDCGLRGKRLPYGTSPAGNTTPMWNGGDKSVDHGNFLINSVNRSFRTGVNQVPNNFNSESMRTAPFHTNVHMKGSQAGINNWRIPSVYNIVEICGKPIKIPKGSRYGIYLVERWDPNTWNSGNFSGSLEFTTYSSVQGGFASVPAIYEIFGEMNMSS